MKAVIKVEKEVNVKYVKLDIYIRHIGDDDGDVPKDFPMLEGNQWKATIDVDNGQILEWPEGYAFDMYCKVCDAGSYTLLDDNNEFLVSRHDYVPNQLIPGGYGDYIDLQIDSSGLIKNWHSSPSVVEFFEEE